MMEYEYYNNGLLFIVVVCVRCQRVTIRISKLLRFSPSNVEVIRSEDLFGHRTIYFGLTIVTFTHTNVRGNQQWGLDCMKTQNNLRDYQK